MSSSTKRPRMPTNSMLKSQEGDCLEIPDSLVTLRRRNPAKYVKELARFFATKVQRCHPLSDIGWWCCYKVQMTDLVTCLSEPQSDNPKFWYKFREEVCNQLSFCRQCAIAYHRAVSVWELSDEVSEWSKVVLRKRVNELVQWDARRLIPLIEKGAISARLCDHRNTLAQRTQCREAFLEALLSLRLCMHQKFCVVLESVFRTRFPARSNEDVVPFIKALGTIPPGLAALCFHSSMNVRKWAQSVYISCRAYLPADEQALELLISKSLRLVQDKANAMCDSSHASTDSWAPNPLSLWEGLHTLLTSSPSQDLEAMVKRNKKFPILDAIINNLNDIRKDSDRSTCSPLPQVLDSLRYVLQSVSYAALFGHGRCSPEKLSDAVFKCISDCSCNSCERRMLLDMLLHITASTTKGRNKVEATKLFLKCFNFLEELELSTRNASHVPREPQPWNEEIPGSSREDTLTAGARLLYRFYCHSSPKLPVDDPKRITAFITNVVRQLPNRECSWDLLRVALFMDVFNLLRCIFDPREVCMVLNTFVSLHADRTAAPEVKVMDAILRDSFDSQVPITWVDGLWDAVRTGCHVTDEKERSEKVLLFEASLIMDLHRLVGVLEPKRCGELVTADRFKQSYSHRKNEDVENFQNSISERIEIVQGTAASRLLLIQDIDRYTSLKQFPFHAAHLLSSSRREIAKHTHFLLQRKYKMHNATYAGPKSQDKLLVHLLGQDRHDSHMIMEGFISVMRIKSAQGAAVSARCYPSFFRWYCLLASRHCQVLRGVEVVRGALGVLLTFLENWKYLQSNTTMEVFREVCCRLFSMIPEVWDSLNKRIESRERRNDGKTTQSSGDVTACVKKAVMKLLAMDDLTDEVVRAAWVRMITHENLKHTFKTMDGCRATLQGITQAREIERRSPDYAPCKRLVDAFDVKRTNQIFDRRALNAIRTTSRLYRKAGTTKRLLANRIDHFFPPSHSRRRSLVSAEGCAVSAANATSQMNGFSGVGAGVQKHHAGDCSKLVRTNGSLHDLRRDHRHARAEFRRTESRYETVQEQEQMRKTRFELLREENIAEKERKKTRIACEGKVMQPSELHLKELCSQEYSEQLRSSSAEERWSLPTRADEYVEPVNFSYPQDCRELRTRCMEQVKRDVLMSSEPHSLESMTYASCPPWTFENLETYVNYWEPLLVAEFRAGIEKKMEEERVFAEQNKRCEEYIGCRSVFAVDGPTEDIGYLQTLSITSQIREDAVFHNDGGTGLSPFDTANVQVSDIVMLEISEAEHLVHCRRKNKPAVVVAIVSTVEREKREVRLALRAVFDNASPPGKGRLLKVSRLLGFATLQRQLDALWLLPKAQDGVLWSLMDPREGWRLKRELECRDERLINRDIAVPLHIAKKMESLGLLNPSQGRAITNVIRSCSCLFAPQGGQGTSQYTKYNHGSMSLIQGPPGTGKSSTIIALLSTLLSCFGSRPYRRRAKIELGGRSHTLSLPAIRVLVCAPSNAAVDELMLRVMENGLFTASGNRVCPRMVRIGRGTTIESLRALSIHSLSKYSDQLPSKKNSTPQTQSGDHRKLLKDVNRQIGELDGDLRTIKSELNGISNCQAPKVSRRGALQFKEIGDKLAMLHNKKKMLLSILSYEREVERKEEASRKREQLKTTCSILASASVVFATLSSSGHEDMKSLGMKFDIIIIDEAGQSCEPDALIPITLNQHVGSPRQRFTHIVLVGDPKQLPATVISGKRRVTTALSQSMFERIGFVDRNIVHILNTQYRMHPKISSFPNKRFYDGLLCNSPDVKNKMMHKAWHQDERKRFGPLTFLDTSKTTTREARSCGGSLINKIEAELVINGLISMVSLYGVENFVDSIAILSPYKQQVLLLQRLVRSKEKLMHANVEVSTIDGIQGREKSIIVLSTVRSGHSRDIGFVKDNRRMNVALTRAKHTLIIFGHADFLSNHSDAWAALISHCRERSQLKTLADGNFAVLPEVRSGYCRLPANAVSPGDSFKSMDDEEEAAIPLITTDKGPKNKKFLALQANTINREPRHDLRLGGDAIHEQSPSKEVRVGSARIEDSGSESRNGTQNRHQRFRSYRIDKAATAVPHRSNGLSNLSEKREGTFDSSRLLHNRSLPLPKSISQDSSWEKGNTQKGSRRITHVNSNRVSVESVLLDVSYGRKSPPSRNETGAKTRAQSSPQINTSSDTEASFLHQRVPVPPERECEPSCVRGDCPRECTVRGPMPDMREWPCHSQFRQERQTQAQRKRSGTSSRGPMETIAASGMTKRALCYVYPSSALKHSCDPKSKRSRKDRYSNQGLEHGNKINRQTNRIRAESYHAQRRRDQTPAGLQVRKQRMQELVRKHQGMNTKCGVRRARLSGTEGVHQIQLEAKKGNAASFSLAETQSKLKSTLDVARQCP